MNGNNVMAVAQPNASGKGGSARISGARDGVRAKAAGSRPGRGSGFQDVMGSTREAAGADRGMGKDAPQDVGVMEDMPQDPIAATIAATRRQKGAAQSAAGRREQGGEAADAADAAAEPMAAAAAGQPAVSRETMQPEMEAESALRIEAAEILEAAPRAAEAASVELQSLLPRSAATDAKQQQMLAALSGQTFHKPMQEDGLVRGASLQPVVQEEGLLTATDLISAQTAQLARENVQFSAGMPGMGRAGQPLNAAVLQPMTAAGPMDMPELMEPLASGPMAQAIPAGAPGLSLREGEAPLQGFMPAANEAAGEGIAALRQDSAMANVVAAAGEGEAIRPVPLAAEVLDSSRFPREELGAQLESARSQAGLPLASTANADEAAAALPREEATQAPFAVPERTMNAASAVGQAAPRTEPSSDAPSGRELLAAIWRDAQEAENPRQAMQDAPQQRGQSFGQPQSAAAAQDALLERTAPAQEGTGAISAFQQAMQDAADVQAAPPSQQPVRDAYDIQRQIVDQARLVRTEDGTEMVIRLKPEHLGDMTLRISVTANGAVNASFHSDNAYVRTIIENSLVQLRQELANQGIKVDNVEVSAQLPDGQMPEGQGQQAWQQAQQPRQGAPLGGLRADGTATEDEGGESAAAAVTEAEGSSAVGVDYRV